MAVADDTVHGPAGASPPLYTNVNAPTEERVHDLPCTANPWLLNKILREEWGFDGYVVSDCGAPGLLVYAHHYVKTKEAAAALCIKSGLDLECGDDVYDLPLRNDYRLGMVSDADIDKRHGCCAHAYAWGCWTAM